MVRTVFRVIAAAAVAFFTVWLMALPASAQETRQQGTGPPAPFDTGVLINLPARTLYWYQHGELKRSFPIAIGSASSRTPTGQYRIQNKIVNPTWYPTNGSAPVPPGPANPLGTRWMAFDGAYGIHGNNNPASIGQVVSAGCVRMFKEDVEWLYDQVRVGTPVHVVYEPVQIQYDAEGQPHLAIYPDVYGRGAKTPAQVLAAAGFDPASVTSTQPGLYPLRLTVVVNGTEVASLLHAGRPYVAARQLGAIMQAEIGWHSGTRQVLIDGIALPSVLHQGSGYVDVQKAVEVLGVTYQRTPGAVRLQGVPLFVNGRLVSRQGIWQHGELYVPVLPLAVSAGVSVLWEGTTRSVLVDGRSIAYQLVDSSAYVRVADLASHLGMGWLMEGGAVKLKR